MKFVHIWRKIHFLAGDCMQQVHAIRKECGIDTENAAKAKTPQALLAVFLLRLSAYSFTNRSRSYSAGMMNESELKIFSVTIGSSVGKPTSTPMTLRPLFATCTVM